MTKKIRKSQEEEIIQVLKREGFKEINEKDLQKEPYKSIYADWKQNPPDWLVAEPWVELVRGQLDVAKAIPNHAFGLQQFIIGQPLWEEYLKGEVDDPRVAAQNAKDAVVAEIEKVS